MGAVLLDDDINEIYVRISSSIINFMRERFSFIGKITSKANPEGLFGGFLPWHVAWNSLDTMCWPDTWFCVLGCR